MGLSKGLPDCPAAPVSRAVRGSDAGREGIPDVLDSGGAVSLVADRDDIESTGNGGEMALVQEAAGAGDDGPLLSWIDRSFGAAEALAPPELHLDEDDESFAPSDEIDLFAEVAVIRSEDPKALPREELGGDPFTSPARALGVAAHPLTHPSPAPPPPVTSVEKPEARSMNW